MTKVLSAIYRARHWLAEKLMSALLALARIVGPPPESEPPEVPAEHEGPTGTLTGTFRRMDGRPAEVEATITTAPPLVHAHGKAWGGPLTVRTDRNGHFAVELVATDDLETDVFTYTVALTIAGQALAVRHGVHVPEGSTVDLVTGEAGR